MCNLKESGQPLDMDIDICVDVLLDIDICVAVLLDIDICVDILFYIDICVAVLLDIDICVAVLFLQHCVTESCCNNEYISVCINKYQVYQY